MPGRKHSRKGGGKHHHKKGSGRRYFTALDVVMSSVPPPADVEVPTIPNPVFVAGQKRAPVGPVLFERVCDSSRPMLTTAEVADRYNGGPMNWGCGAKFRWYLGMSCVCPGCGHTYPYTSDELRQKKFWIQSSN